MAADPADIAKYTKDGVTITAFDAALQSAHPESTDERDQEIEMFYVLEADGQAMLDEKHGLLSKLNPVHKGIEVDERIDLGGSIPLTPVVPSFHVIDVLEDVDAVARLRAFAYELGQDRFSVEVIE